MAQPAESERGQPVSQHRPIDQDRNLRARVLCYQSFGLLLARQAARLGPPAEPVVRPQPSPTEALSVSEKLRSSRRSVT